MKGQQVSCILFHSVNFCISGSASSSSWCCFCAAPAPLSDVARQNGRHPQGSPDRTRAESSWTRCNFVLPIMSLSRHTFCFTLYRTLCRITDYLIRPAASRNALGARFHRALISNTAYESSISIKFDSIYPNIDCFLLACHEPSVCCSTFGAFQAG